MLIALVTDLHANREAVTAVLAHAQAQGAQRRAFLGDFVGYGADPAWVVDLVREHVAGGDIAVMGNHDIAVVRGAQDTMVAQAAQVVEWTRAQLDATQLDFLANLPMSIVEGEVLFVHANAHAPAEWEYVVDRNDAARSIAATECRFTFCGHMHTPLLFHRSGAGKVAEFHPVPGAQIPLSRERRWLAIPGSAGQPRDGNPAACYAMFDTESATLTFHRVPYDHDAAGARICAVGLPQALAQRLHDGQ